MNVDEIRAENREEAMVCTGPPLSHIVGLYLCPEPYMIDAQQRTLHRLVQRAPHETVPGIRVLKAVDLEFADRGSRLRDYLAFSDGFERTLNRDGVHSRLEDTWEEAPVFDRLDVAVGTIVFGSMPLDVTDFAHFGAERQGLLLDARRINQRPTDPPTMDLLARWEDRLEVNRTGREATGTDCTESGEGGRCRDSCGG